MPDLRRRSRGPQAARRLIQSGRRPGGAAAVHYVCGTYAAYSHAWSPYFRDQLIRGSLLIEPGKGNRFVARYREILPSGPVELTGAAILVGRVLHLELHEAGSGAPIYFSIFLSGRPASVLSGVASGATLAGPDPQPSATRIVLIRVPDGSGAALERSNQYLAPEVSALAADFATAGILPAEPQAAAAELRSFLRSGDRIGHRSSQPGRARAAGGSVRTCGAAIPGGRIDQLGPQHPPSLSSVPS